MTFTFLTGALGAPVTATYSTGNIAVPIPDVSTVDIPINITDTVSSPTSTSESARIIRSTATSRSSWSDPMARSFRWRTRRQRRQLRQRCHRLLRVRTTVFDDAAATAIGAGTAPFAGTFRPEIAAFAFNGKTIYRHVEAASDRHCGAGYRNRLLRPTGDHAAAVRLLRCAGTPQIASGGAPTITPRITCRQQRSRPG